MPELFLDTEAAVAILTKREPHYKYSIQLLELAANDEVQILIAESSLANLIYLCFDIYKLKNASELLKASIHL